MTIVFKHAVLRQPDGDDIIIWASNSLQDAEDDEDGEQEDATTRPVEKRQQQYVDQSWVNFRSGGPDQCGHSSMSGRTGSLSPFTGGILAMARWGHAYNQHARFSLGDDGWRNIVVAGSNSGANARFSCRRVRDAAAIGFGQTHWSVGSRDIADLARDTEARYKQQINGWRASANGRMPCNDMTRDIDLFYRGSIVDWEILRSVEDA